MTETEENFHRGTSAELFQEANRHERSVQGPFDDSEANPVRPYIDLGGIKTLPRDGLQLRLEVEEESKRVVAVSFEYAQSVLQVQAFAAPRSQGLWGEIRKQISEQIGQQGGTALERTGTFGEEIFAEIPVTNPKQQMTLRHTRFIGVDGPRWFLRGVVSGAALTDERSMLAIDDLFRSIVVVRGHTAMPPRELIPLRVPSTAGATASVLNG